MRRCLTISTISAAVMPLSRSVHSVAVVNNVPPATVVNKLGVPATREEVAKAHRLPLNILDKAENPLIIRFTQMEIARSTYAPLIASVTPLDDFRLVERSVEERYRGDASKQKPVPGAMKKLKETQWKSMKDLVTFYEETMYPIRVAHRAYVHDELSNFHISDVLKRGLSAFKQEFLDEQKLAQTKVKASMQKHKDFIATCVKDAFDTALCNDIANILRIAGEKHEQAHSMSVKVLDDMNLMGVAYDEMTREISKATIFGDGPFDDSQLLFEVIEYPERGEISVGAKKLQEVSTDILKLISNRHQTPLDADHTLLYSNETHPNLQRSVE